MSAIQPINQQVRQRPRAYGDSIVRKRQRSAAELPGCIWPHSTAQIAVLLISRIVQDSTGAKARFAPGPEKQPGYAQVLCCCDFSCQVCIWLKRLHHLLFPVLGVLRQMFMINVAVGIDVR